MQPVLRHSRRLSSRICKDSIRRFSVTRRYRSSDWRPEERDTTRSQEVANKRQEERDDPQNESQDGAETRRQGLRRTLRQRRLVEPPKPPPLPAWFLERNVTLHRQATEQGQRDGSDGVREIECVAARSGEVLFRTPWTRELGALVDPKGEKRPTTSSEQDVLASRRTLTPNLRQQTSDMKSDGHMDGLSDFRQATAESTDLEPTSAALIEAETLTRATFSLAGQNASTYALSKTGLSLECADETAHSRMDHLVRNLASVVDADIITLDANDIADLTGDYVGQGNDLPGTFSTLAHDVFEGRHSHKIISRDAHVGKFSFDRPEQDEDQDENEEDEDDDVDADARNDTNPMHRFKSIGDFIKSRLQDVGRNHGNTATAFSFAVPAGIVVGRARSDRPPGKNDSASDYVQWDDARLSALLEQLLDAAEVKRTSRASTSDTPEHSSALDTDNNAQTQTRAREWRHRTESTMSKIIATNVSAHNALVGVDFRLYKPAGEDEPIESLPRTIVHLKDLHDISASKLGDVIVRRLSKVIQKRRRLGQQVMLVGTSAGARADASENEDSPFIDITVPSEASATLLSAPKPQHSQSVEQVITDRGYHRILETNLRNISSMLRRVRPEHNDSSSLMSCEQDQLLLPGAELLSEKILSQEQVHRIVLGAIGTSQTYFRSPILHPIHISLATAVLAVGEETASRAQPISAIPFRLGERIASLELDQNSGKDRSSRERLEQIRKSCNSHETKLLSGVVDAQNIKTGFKDVHVVPETIEALRTLTTLSLLRPDAFRYGVLATDSLSGLMLYGPPGTGKTLLAKAVAKESRATVLEISGAQVYEKYVGEGEKMVRAVFTLAKKLSPCVVFIDEADALFGTRSSAGNRSTHREIINQFLREWDGMDDHRVFVMVASNRPFDMDDAVLRRLPRRLLVDLPLATDREKILAIHLRDEALDSAVSLSKLAEQTPLYSGSDLKNLCVAAALAAVREENELASQHADDSDFKLPEKRTLQLRHFDKGLQEITASISEDMSSLTAIRKFDEQYGDKKGRRKKASYGFGALGGPIDETAARVRQGP